MSYAVDAGPSFSVLKERKLTLLLYLALIILFWPRLIMYYLYCSYIVPNRCELGPSPAMFKSLFVGSADVAVFRAFDPRKCEVVIVS